MSDEKPAAKKAAAKKTTARKTSGKDSGFLVVRTPFAIGATVYAKGTVFEADDERIVGREHLFVRPEDQFRTTRRS